MKWNFVVIFQATCEVEVGAENESQAKALARAQLDPDVDWDLMDIERIPNG